MSQEAGVIEADSRASVKDRFAPNLVGFYLQDVREHVRQIEQQALRNLQFRKVVRQPSDALPTGFAKDAAPLRADQREED